MSEDSRELVPVAPVQPLVSPEQAAQHWKLFLDLKKKLLDEHDYQMIADKRVICKSGFRKFSLVFNLTDRILESEKVEREDGSFYWRIVVEVEAPNGRTCSGVGICDSRERSFAHVEHDVYATCHTRAKNRGVSDMVAGGVVSAEEMTAAPRTTTKAKSTSKKKATPKNTPEAKAALKEVTLKKGWSWDKVFKKFGPEIQTRQEQLGELWSFESAAVVFAREKDLVKEQELPQ